MNKTKSQQVVESRRKNVDVIQFGVPKGQRDVIKQYASSQGLTMNEFIRHAINQAMSTNE